MTTAAPWFLLLLVPVLGLALYLYAWHRSDATAHRRFATPALIERLIRGASEPRPWIGHALLFGALTCLVIALAQPQWGTGLQDAPQRGRDIVVLLDTSLSMLAEDAKPNRFERAKAAIHGLVNVVQQDGGHRLGLIGFAGRAALHCPPTLDYAFFRRRLDELDVGAISRQGSLIGDAIHQTLNGFGGIDDAHTDLILITDGEDHDSLPAESAREAAARGIAIHAIGIGDPIDGAVVPLPGVEADSAPLLHDGREVTSRLDRELILSIAKQTGGMAMVAGTAPIDITPIYHDHIADKPRRALGETENELPVHRFQWFLALALVLLCADMLRRALRQERDRDTAPNDQRV